MLFFLGPIPWVRSGPAGKHLKTEADDMCALCRRTPDRSLRLDQIRLFAIEVFPV
ncbi:hypothetical protein LY76DRAFT_592295 [Colletotrichum caudatum]|nr:hypothetical protein LY76DRAFT_592295 [Colletotrichum caudatum]